MRLARILTVSCAALCASVTAAALELETLPGTTDELVYHLRLESPKASELNFTVVWNYADPDRRCRLKVRATPGIQADELLGGSLAYELWQGDSLVSQGRSRSDHALTADRGLSAVLNYNSAGAFVQIGDAGPLVNVPVDFDAAPGQTVGFDAAEDIRLIRNDIRATQRAPEEYVPFTDVTELADYIAASRDPRERVWTYLDRNTDPQKCEPGGRYTIATVKDGASGGYLIVYLGGADYARGDWQPLQIKGRLKPTIFRDHFDLEWYDSRRRVVAAEANASITTSGTVLELNFPLLNSTLRFSRK